MVTWASSNTAVATVNGSGLVSGVAAGPATITATSEGQSGMATVTVTNVPVATVAVSPVTAGVQVGATVQLTATPKDASGNPLSGRVVTWASSNTAVATVNGSGLVSGVVAGPATITATSEGKSGTAALTVTATVTTPGTVTDLAVAGVTDTALTLAFTEVSDGTGQPASYDVRYAVGTLSWSAAPSVGRGSCTTPVAGSVIGAKRSCTVLGLTAATGYQVQLVAFRGTLNVNAVFGALSNLASGTTAASTAPVATVTLSPASASLAVGATQPLTATLKDAAGNVLTGRSVTWATSNAAVATVNGSGLVAGLVVGAVTITATSESRNGTAAITVTALPPPGAWPNEPTGMTVVTDMPWNVTTGLGWTAWPHAMGDASIVADASASFSPVNVLQQRYPIGFVGGDSPSNVNYDLPPGMRELYVGMWWKPSNPWQPHSSGVNKIAFFKYADGTNQELAVMRGTGPYYLEIERESTETLWLGFENVPVTLGVWHRLEFYFNPTGGIIKFWFDGTLVGNYSGRSFPNQDWGFISIDPTWGGVGESKSETDYYWYDHTHISWR